MEKLWIYGKREGYSVKQCGKTLTVGELIEFLQDFDEDTPIYFNNDNGYTFGSLNEDDFEMSDEEDEE